MYLLDTNCVGDKLDTIRTIRSMDEWYVRAKARMSELGITQEDLLPVFGVTTRGAVGHYLSGRRDPSPSVMVKLADRLGMGLDELLRGSQGPQSQGMRLDLPMLSEALVSLDKALRKMGLRYDAAYVAPVLMLAYRERLKHPAQLDDAAYALYDSLVYQQLQGGKDGHERDAGRTQGASPRSHRKAAPRRP
jgi:transcriptional regulator with XRE-family HTH domain